MAVTVEHKEIEYGVQWAYLDLDIGIVIAVGIHKDLDDLLPIDRFVPLNGDSPNVAVYAIKAHIVPKLISQKQKNLIYASEADVLNVALFGITAKQWQKENSDKKGNIRDYADVRQLVCLANMESLNAEFIRQKISQPERLMQLNQIAIIQMKSLVNSDIKRI